MAHWKRFIYVVIALFSLQLTARAQETETFVHTIKQGETVYSIARTYQVSPESILKLNPTGLYRYQGRRNTDDSATAKRYARKTFPYDSSRRNTLQTN